MKTIAGLARNCKYLQICRCSLISIKFGTGKLGQILAENLHFKLQLLTKSWDTFVVSILCVLLLALYKINCLVIRSCVKFVRAKVRIFRKKLNKKRSAHSLQIFFCCAVSVIEAQKMTKLF